MKMGSILAGGCLFVGVGCGSTANDEDFSTDVAEAVEMRNLDAGQVRQLCEDVLEYWERERTFNERLLCQPWSIRSIDGAKNDAEARQQCEVHYQQCRKDFAALEFGATECGNGTYPETCSVTVGEMVDCSNELRDIQERWLEELPDCAAVSVSALEARKALADEGVPVQRWSSSCSSYASTCSSFTLDE
jgi:hypothetical protein